jgi:hypothetical protein
MLRRTIGLGKFGFKLENYRLTFLIFVIPWIR